MVETRRPPSRSKLVVPLAILGAAVVLFLALAGWRWVTGWVD